MNKSIFITLIVLLFIANIYCDRDILFSPILRGKTINFEIKWNKTLKDKKYKISSIITSCKCLTVNKIKTNKGYILKTQLTTKNQNGYKKKEIFINSNNWNDPIEKIVIKYYVVKPENQIEIIIKDNKNKYKNFIKKLKNKYNKAIKINFLKSKTPKYILNNSTYYNYNIFKTYLFLKLNDKYQYLDF